MGIYFKKLLFFIFLLFCFIACSKSPKFKFENYNLGKRFRDKNKVKDITMSRLVTTLSTGIGSYLKLDNKYIVLNRLTPYMNTAGVVYGVNNKFQIKELKKIPMGKGPGEGIALTDIQFLNGKYYIFDRTMHRFLIYDKEFNYKETYNLNRPIPLSSFFTYKGNMYAILGKVKKMIFYKATFDKKLKLKKEYEFEYEKAKHNEKNKKHNRGNVTVLKNDNDYLITKSFNLICYFNKKDKIKKDREIYMGYEEDGDSVTIPSIIFTDSRNNILFRCGTYKYYDYKRDEKNEVDKKLKLNKVLMFKNKIYSFTYNENEKNKIYLKKKE